MIGGMGGGSRDGVLMRQVLEIILINIKKYNFFRWFECTNFPQILRWEKIKAFGSIRPQWTE